jgi:sugar lactone lactonase YvrE
VVHHFTVSPDDITVDAGGRLWVTAREANLLIGMDPAGGAVTTQDAPGGPEGVVADGASLYVAQQNLNAVQQVAPTSRTLVTLPNHTSNAGIDGIAIDVANHRLLIPDSPTGELFAVPLSGPATPELLASGLGRPVAAATDDAGDIIVASESSPALTVLTRAGVRRSLGHFTDLDEVVGYAGLLYVAELDRHDVVAVDPASGASVPVAVNLPAPQGLAVTASGTLEIVDATTNALYSMPSCGAGP